MEVDASHIIKMPLEDELAGFVVEDAHGEVVSTRAEETESGVKLHGADSAAMILINGYALLETVVNELDGA